MRKRTKDLIVGWFVLLFMTAVVLLIIATIYFAYTKSLFAGIAITVLFVVAIVAAEK